MVRIKIKGCLRCGGDLMYHEDAESAEWTCVQCAFYQFVDPKTGEILKPDTNPRSHPSLPKGEHQKKWEKIREKYGPTERIEK
jgi:ribosomal protein S27AE